jgi:hypothetical protein
VIAQALGKPPKPPRPDELNSADSKIVTDSLLKIEDFWLSPLAHQQSSGPLFPSIQFHLLGYLG